MGGSRNNDDHVRSRKTPAAAALSALARTTPAEAACALRLWQSRTGQTDAETSRMLEQLEHEFKALPKGTSIALATAEAPPEPSPVLELYAQVLVFLAAVRESARRVDA